MQEILEMRPYSSLIDMFYDEEGKWKHSKMNKTCLASLCKIEALQSLDEFQDGKIGSHRQLLEALLFEKNYESLRKGIYGITATQIKRMRKNGEEPTVFLDKILSDNIDIEDWSRVEKISLSYDLTSTVDSDLAKRS